jgi:hypothetical protein
MTTVKRAVHVAVVFGCVATAFASAQTITGKVTDRTTGAPIASASVTLLNPAGQVQKMAITRPDGTYSLKPPSPGSYTFRVDAPGYNTHNEQQFAALAGRRLEIDMSLVSYVELPAVTVTADSVPFAPGPLEGFYERKERGRGQFITREEIDMMAVNRFTDLLRMTPSVDVVSLGGTQYTIRIKGAGRIGGDCAPQLWVDNVRWGTVDLEGEGPDRAIYPSEIAAIEVYRPSAVPIDFAAFDLSCGVVVVWTKRAP